MVLTNTELRRIQILEAKATGATIEEVAAQFDVSVSCVSKAIRWGKQHRINNLTAVRDLAVTVAALEDKLKWLEKQRRAYEKLARERDKLLPVGFVQMYLRQSREYEMALAELRGFYNRSLNVNVSGEVSFLEAVEAAHERVELGTN